MILPESVTESITAAGIDISSGWLSSSIPVWNSTYSTILSQPISIAVTPLADLRFLGSPTATITIRSTSTSTSLVLWSGVATLVSDGTTGGGLPTFPPHNSLTARDAADAHPLASIAGLEAALDAKAPAFVSAAANQFWATPNGAPGLPSLRSPVPADIPSLDAAKIATGVFDPARIPELTIVHNALSGRSDANSHPTAAITGLDAALALPGIYATKYGAVSDYNKTTYAGTDNAAAFQAAATAAAAAGVPLVVPPGQYYLGSSVTLACDMIGGGEICIDHKTALRTSGYGGGIASLATAIVLRGSSFQIKDVKFWSPGRHLYDPALPGAVNGGMYNHILIEGTVGAPSAANLVSRCKFFGANFGSVLFGSYCAFPSVNSNEFYGCAYHVLYDDQASGFKAVGSYGFDVSNSKFQGYDWASTATAWATTNHAWGGDAIEINAPVGGTHDVSIKGNRIDNVYSSTTASGIGIGLANVQKFIVVGNYLNYATLDGIHIEDRSSDGSIVGNYAYETNKSGGGGAITSQQCWGLLIEGNRVNRPISVNGGNAGSFIANTSEPVKVIGNYLTNTSIYVISQSNVSVDNNDVHRVSTLAPGAGQDGIQITTGGAASDPSMTNVLVENNRVSGWYREIAVTGLVGAVITSVRIAKNYAPANPLSAAPANEKQVWWNSYTSGIESYQNDDIGINPRLLAAPSIPEGVMIGNAGDLTTLRGGGYGESFWLKLSGDNTNGTWLPVGHMGIKILSREDGTAISSWARHIRYKGTGGHNFAIAAATETGRKLSFGHYGSGSPITVTPATGTINGFASISIPVGFLVDIVDDNNESWHIEAVGGIQPGWAADTGTAKKTANATYAVGAALTVGAAYAQAEVTAIITRQALMEAALRDATQTIKALKDLLLARYEIGA